jgi:hypothetical protein
LIALQNKTKNKDDNETTRRVEDVEEIGIPATL